MNLLLLLAGTAVLAHRSPESAALLWTVGIAFFHMVQETRGKLWVYFGQTTGFAALTRLPAMAGFVLIVLPAFVLQTAAAYMAFSATPVDRFFLAILIGARLGDGLLSHVIPFAQGYSPVASGKAGSLNQLNPGLPTAAIYIVDAILLTILWFNVLTPLTGREDVLIGVSIGVGFFALVQPTLRLLGWLTTKKK